MARKMTLDDQAELEKEVLNLLAKRDLIDVSRTATVTICFSDVPPVKVQTAYSDRSALFYYATDEVLTDDQWQELLTCEDLKKMSGLIEFLREHKNTVKVGDVPKKFRRSMSDSTEITYFDDAHHNRYLKKLYMRGKLTQYYRLAEERPSKGAPKTLRIAICRQRGWRSK